RQVGQAERAGRVSHRSAGARRRAADRSAGCRPCPSRRPRLGWRGGLVLRHVAPGATGAALHPERPASSALLAGPEAAGAVPAPIARAVLPASLAPGGGAARGRLLPAAPALP